jgi:hypothetical protein
MTFNQFKTSLFKNAAPAGLGPALTALWADGRGDWDGAHDIVQQDEGIDASWVHAYLHRKEGDLANAGYWYRRAGKPPGSGSLESEWRDIATTLLNSL